MHILLCFSWFIPDKIAEFDQISTFCMQRHLENAPTSQNCPSFVVHTFKLEYLWSQLANPSHILCVASLGWGKVCIRFWGSLDQNSGFHGNRKPLSTYNGENDVSTFSRLFFIRSFLYLQVIKMCIQSPKSSNFGQIGPLTVELAALEHLKNFP